MEKGTGTGGSADMIELIQKLSDGLSADARFIGNNVVHAYKLQAETIKDLRAENHKLQEDLNAANLEVDKLKRHLANRSQLIGQSPEAKEMKMSPEPEVKNSQPKDEECDCDSCGLVRFLAGKSNGSNQMDATEAAKAVAEALNKAFGGKATIFRIQ